MAETLKNPKEKAEYARKLAKVRPFLPGNPASVLTTIRPDFETEHVYNVLRTPIRRYDDDILAALIDLATPRMRAKKRRPVNSSTSQAAA